eukprot:55338_1
MGTCGSTGYDTIELIEIRNSINKQNESIQSMIISTKTELKIINDKICEIENKLQNQFNHGKCNIINTDIKEQISELSNQIENVKKCNQNNQNNIKQQSFPLSQRKFPKPRTVKLYSHNRSVIKPIRNNINNRIKWGNNVPDINDKQLNDINVKLNSMRNVIRNEMQIVMT